MNLPRLSVHVTLFSFLPFAAAILSLLLAVASLLRKKPSLATWCFFAGMAVLGIDSLFTGLSLRATQLSEVLRWLTLALIVKSFVPAAWLGFSLTYSRGDYRESLARWRIPLAIARSAAHRLVARLPASNSSRWCRQGRRARCCSCASARSAKALNVILLVALVLDPDEPGTDLPIGGRNDALADQVRGPGPGGDLRRPPLRPEPGNSLFRVRHRAGRASSRVRS